MGSALVIIFKNPKRVKNKDWLEPFNVDWKHSETLTQSSNHKYRSKKWCGEKSNLPNQTRPNVFDSFCDCSSKINKAFYLLVVKIIHSQFPFCHTELLSQEVILGDHYECKGQHDSTQWTHQNNTVKVLITSIIAIIIIEFLVQLISWKISFWQRR